MAIEFDAIIIDGTIHVPDCGLGGETVRVIIYPLPVTSEPSLLRQMLETPRKVKHFRTFSRDELHER
jgi:hypothetical protein